MPAARNLFKFVIKLFHVRHAAKLFACLLMLSSGLTSCQKEDIGVSTDYRILGSAAHDLLTASTYDRLEIEIGYMPGYEPGDNSMKQLQRFLDTYLNKPAGITIFKRQIPASGKRALRLAEIVSIERKYRTNFTAGRTLGVHILVTDGDYEGKDIFATSYWNTSFCVFGKTVYESSGGIGQVSRSELTSALLQHEFGHLLGLVNQGSPMQGNHVDPDNGAHCDDPDCLMYFEIESSNTLGSMGSIPTLDANCVADLKANGGK